MTNNPNLRKELQDAADIFHHIGHEAQAKIILGLTEIVPHSIQLISLNGKYNCYEYALGLWHLEEYKCVARVYQDIFAGEEFIEFLLNSKKLHGIEEQNAQPGDITIYFDGVIPKHAGIVQHGKVHSKWGAGSLWKHEAFEVPSSYGDPTRYFSKVEDEQAAEYFKEWLKSKGIEETLL